MPAVSLSARQDEYEHHGRRVVHGKAREALEIAATHRDTSKARDGRRRDRYSHGAGGRREARRTVAELLVMACRSAGKPFAVQAQRTARRHRAKRAIGVQHARGAVEQGDAG